MHCLLIYTAEYLEPLAVPANNLCAKYYVPYCASLFLE